MKTDKSQVFVWQKISAIETLVYDGPVHNLQVDGPECFVAEGVCVHNCPHFGEVRVGQKLHPRECAELWNGV